MAGPDGGITNTTTICGRGPVDQRMYNQEARHQVTHAGQGDALQQASSGPGRTSAAKEQTISLARRE